jgi:polysaccharide chain length determinant protein (PEP-CTERM system associated)
MHELFDKVSEFIWGVWRYRWTALLTAWIVALLGWLMVAQVDARYPATARLFVDSNRILEPLLNDIAVKPNLKQQVSLISKTLLSRPNLEELIDDLDLLSTFDGVTREGLIKALQDDIEILDTNESKSIYVVSYSHEDPQVAIDVVQHMIDIFVSSSQNADRSDNQTAQRFLDIQIEDYEERLIAAEQRLAAFKRKHAGSLPGEAGGFYKRLENLVQLERTAELELQEAINQRNTLRANLAEEERKIRGSARNSSPFDARIRELQGQLDELLVRYTQRHPQVSILEQSIEDLRQQKARAGGGSNNSSRLLQGSIVYQELTTLLAEAEAEVAKLQVRTANYSQRVSNLESTVDSIPAVEAELTQLDRDYETVREQHQILLNKREAARLTGNIEKDSNDTLIRAIDPPFVPSRPTDPDRLLLTALTLIGSIIAGVLIAFFLSLLNPVFYNKRALEHVTQLPVLGVVTLNHSRSERVGNFMKHIKFTALAALLPITCAALLYTLLNNTTLYENLKFSTEGDTTVAALEKQ